MFVYAICVVCPPDVYVNMVCCPAVGSKNHSETKWRILEFLSIHSLKITSYANCVLILVRWMMSLILEQLGFVVNIFLHVIWNWNCWRFLKTHVLKKNTFPALEAPMAVFVSPGFSKRTNHVVQDHFVHTYYKKKIFVIRSLIESSTHNIPPVYSEGRFVYRGGGGRNRLSIISFTKL